MKDIFRKFEGFILSELFAPLIFLVTYGLIVLDLPVAAIVLLVLVGCMICLSSEDLVPLLLPLFLIFCVFFICLEDFSADYIWVFLALLPCASVLIYRFVRSFRRIRLGIGFPGLIFVSLALMLGGIGAIPASEYFAVGSLYYMFFLGPMMVFIYLLAKASAGAPRSYCVGDKIAAAFYLVAVFLAFLVLRAYVMHLDILFGGQEIEDLIREALPWRNIAANMSVACFPFIFYYARKHNPIHAAVACLLYLVMLSSGSRGAALCGALVLLAGFVYLAWGRRRTVLVLLGILAAGLVAAFLLRSQIAHLLDVFFGFHNFGTNGDHFVELDGFNLLNETRYKMLLRSFEDFFANPVFGQGLGAMNNTDIYAPPTDWHICWYHSAIPQIIGSLGLVGILAYGYQFFFRVRLILLAERDAYTGALALGYFAIIAYSMIDPGVFVPLPYAFLAVLLTVFLENRAGERGLLSQNHFLRRIPRLFKKKES